jgi:hypothetical protein
MVQSNNFMSAKKVYEKFNKEQKEYHKNLKKALLKQDLTESQKLDAQNDTSITR